MCSSCMYALVWSMLFIARFMLFTAHYLSLTFAMWHSLLITCVFLMFAVCLQVAYILCVWLTAQQLLFIFGVSVMNPIYILVFMLLLH